MPKVKRLNKTIHPNSRKALQLASKENRKQRTIKSHNDTKTKKGVLIRKILWFREQIVPKDGEEESMQTETYSESKFDEFRKKEKEVFTVDEIKSLIELYFQRFDAEIDQINTKKAIGNRNIGQHFSREKAIEITLENEKHEYETVGLEVPDLTIPKMVAFIRNWNGQANALPAIKLKTIKKQ